MNVMAYPGPKADAALGHTIGEKESPNGKDFSQWEGFSPKILKNRDFQRKSRPLTGRFFPNGKDFFQKSYQGGSIFLTQS